MKPIGNIMFSLLCLFFIPGFCSAEGLCTRILREMDNNAKYEFDLTAKVSLLEERATMGIRESKLLYHQRASDDAFLLVYLSPERDKGNGYLRVEDNIWMYRINTRTFQHMSRSDRIGDSLLSAENFETRKLTELYSPVTDDNGNEIYEEEVLGKILVYKFEVRAKVRDVSYHKRIYWVEKENFLLLKQSSYSLSGTLMQTLYFTKYTEIGNKYIPQKYIVIDEFEKGNRNIITVSGISLENVDDSVFTKAYFENLSK